MNSSAQESTVFVLHKNDGTSSIHQKTELSEAINETVEYVAEVDKCNHRLVAVYTPNAKLSVTPAFSMATSYDGELIEGKQFIDVKTFKQCSQLLYTKRYAFGRNEFIQLDHSTKLLFVTATNIVTLPLLGFDGNFLDDEVFHVLHSAQLSARNMKHPDNKDYGFYWSYNCSGLVFNCKYELLQTTKYELVKFNNQ